MSLTGCLCLQVNVSLGMAALLRESTGGSAAANAKVEAGSRIEEKFASEASYKIEAGKEYVLSVSIETTRTNDVPEEVGALNTALGQVRSTDVDAIAEANRRWWEEW